MLTRCVLAAGVDGGGVALVTAQGHRATVCATDEVAALVEDLQFLVGEGPCVDATANRSPVLVSDVEDRSEGVQDRWPAFLDGAAGAGVRAVFGFPLTIGAVPLGAMDLYRRTPGPLDPDELRAALLTADSATAVLLDLATGAPAGNAAWLQPGLRFKVHGAAGMVSAQLGASIEQALVQLRAVAFADGRSVEEVADDVIAGKLTFPREDA
ncbi:MAG: GAF and ANTAR domain-containing protein [Actinomycetes bacterium]